MNKFFTHKNAFLRQRKISLQDLVGLILKQAADSNQFGLSITSQLYFEENAPNKQSVSEARQKISWEFFKSFYDFIVEKNNDLKQWKSHCVKIVDGTRIRIPRTDSLIKKFGAPVSQVGQNHYPCVSAVILSDAFSSMPLGVSLGEYNSSERDLATSLFAKTSPGDILLLDRGLGGIKVYNYLNKKNIFFIHRAIKSVKYIKEFIKSNSESEIVEIKTENRNELIQLRLIRGRKLANGEILVYVTNLINSKKYTSNEIDELYGLRWKIETNISTLKNTIQIEKIRSKSINSVLQDIFAHFIVLAMGAITQSEVTKKINLKNSRSLSMKYIFKVIGNNIRLLCSIKTAKCAWIKICDLVTKIIWIKQKDRHYLRYSRQPQNKWSHERAKIKKGLFKKNSR